MDSRKTSLRQKSLSRGSPHTLASCAKKDLKQIFCEMPLHCAVDLYFSVQGSPTLKQQSRVNISGSPCVPANLLYAFWSLFCVLSSHCDNVRLMVRMETEADLQEPCTNKPLAVSDFLYKAHHIDNCGPSVCAMLIFGLPTFEKYRQKSTLVN